MKGSSAEEVEAEDSVEEEMMIVLLVEEEAEEAEAAEDSVDVAEAVTEVIDYQGMKLQGRSS